MRTNFCIFKVRGVVSVACLFDAIAELRVAVYWIGGWKTASVDNAVHLLSGELHCDVKDTYSHQIQPLTRDHPQVDVIVCFGKEITSVATTYHLNEQIAGW